MRGILDILLGVLQLQHLYVSPHECIMLLKRLDVMIPGRQWSSTVVN